MSSKIKAVRFLMPHTVGCLYIPDEVAGFDEDVADDLIKREIAEDVKNTKKTGEPNNS